MHGPININLDPRCYLKLFKLRKGNSGRTNGLGHSYFLPNPFQFVSHIAICSYIRVLRRYAPNNIYIFVLFSFFLAPFSSVLHLICFASLPLPYCVIVFLLYGVLRKQQWRYKAKNNLVPLQISPPYLRLLFCSYHYCSPSLTNTSLNALPPHYWHTYCFTFSYQHISEHYWHMYCFHFSYQHISQRSAATLHSQHVQQWPLTQTHPPTYDVCSLTAQTDFSLSALHLFIICAYFQNSAVV